MVFNCEVHFTSKSRKIMITIAGEDELQSCTSAEHLSTICV